MSLALDITVFDSAKIVIKGTYKLFSYDIQIARILKIRTALFLGHNPR